MIFGTIRNFFFFSLFLAAPLSAQVTVDVALEHASYLAFEPILATVTIHNFSSDPIFLSDDADQPWFSFHLETEQGRLLPVNQKESAMAPVSLAAGATWSQKINLLAFYPLEDFGNYRLSAIVFISAFQRYFHSSARFFEITEGHLFTQQTIEIPDATHAVFEKRKVALLGHRRSDRTDLYLRIEDPERELIFCTYSLGRIISSSKPELLFDKKNHIHILQQEAPGIFFYTRADLQGHVLERQSWRALPVRPKLVMTPQGAIHVEGGTMIVNSDLKRKR